MRAKHTALILTAGFLLLPTMSWSQFPGFGGGGASGGGTPGGMRTQMDPNFIFNMLSGGKDVIDVDQMDPRMKVMFDRFAPMLGFTGNQISREQFSGAMTKAREMAGSGQPGGMNFRTIPAEGKPGVLAAAPDGDQRIDEYFKRLDRDEDGVLQYDEMSETLQNERDKYDLNHDGVIDLNEFKAYVAARFAPQDGGGAKPGVPGAPDKPASEDEEKKKPTLIRAGNLPRDFPYASLDLDHDGQIGLYEWKESGKRIAEFLPYDLNNDGFLTVDEYYRWRKKDDEARGKTGSAAGEFARSGRGMSGPGGMMAMNGFGMGGERAPGGFGMGGDRGAGGFGMGGDRGRGPGGFGMGGDRGTGGFGMGGDSGQGGFGMGGDRGRAPGGYGMGGDRSAGGYGTGGDRGPGGFGMGGNRGAFLGGGDRGTGGFPGSGQIPGTGGGYTPGAGGFSPGGGLSPPTGLTPSAGAGRFPGGGFGSDRGTGGDRGSRGPRGFGGPGGGSEGGGGERPKGGDRKR